MKRVITYAGTALICLIGGYLAGFQRASNHSVGTCDTFNSDMDDARPIIAALRNARRPTIVEISTTDATKPIVHNGTRYSFAEAKKWLDDLSARFGNLDPVLIVLHERDPVGTVSAIVEIAKKYCNDVYTILLSDSNTPCYTVSFSKIKQTGGWEMFIENYHFSTPAPKDFTVDMNKILLAPSVLSPTNSPP
jgi:hypothetical protein